MTIKSYTLEVLFHESFILLYDTDGLEICKQNKCELLKNEMNDELDPNNRFKND